MGQEICSGVWERTGEVVSRAARFGAAEVPFAVVLEATSPFGAAFVMAVRFVLTTRRLFETPEGGGRVCFSLVLEVSDRESSTPVRGRWGAIRLV
jgi:hypothetical protein